MERGVLSARELLSLLSPEKLEKYVDIAEVRDFGANQLKLGVEEMSAKKSSPPVTLGPISGLTPIAHQASDLIFELSWERYIVFEVLNESYDSGNGRDEAWEGKLFRKYSASRYLNYVRATYENVKYLAEDHQHWAISGLNRHVHVISKAEPTVRIHAPN